jgi:hypothetical protein
MRAALTIALVFTFIGLSFMPPIMGNPAGYSQLYESVVFNVQSPQNGATYNMQTIPLYFTFKTNINGQLPTCYILNNQTPIDVPVWITSKETSSIVYGNQSHTYTYTRYIALGNTVLKNLPNGKYNLTVERYYGAISNPQKINSTTVSFTIDTTKTQSTAVFTPPPAPYPKLTLISPNNSSNVAPFTGADYRTGGTLDYYETIVKFESNVLPSWVGYSIDGGTKTTVPIYDYAKVKLPLGSHYFTLYGNDTMGNWANPQTVYFSVITFKDWVESGQQKTTSQTPTPSVPEFSYLTILSLLLSIPIVLVIVRKRIQRNV